MQRSPSLVEVSGRVTDTRLELRVRDNGLGVPREKREKLFQRFFRAHETVTGAEGTGLGLSIVRETAESVGGEAWAEFTDEGSTFVVALPFRRGEGPERRSSDGQRGADNRRS